MGRKKKDSNDDKYKRVNILITPEQHEMVAKEGLSLSGLVRDLLHDRFADTKIVLTVSKRTKGLYDTVVSNFGVGDHELETFFVGALDEFLKSRSKELEDLRKRLKKSG